MKNTKVIKSEKNVELVQAFDRLNKITYYYVRNLNTKLSSGFYFKPQYEQAVELFNREVAT